LAKKGQKNLNRPGAKKKKKNPQNGERIKPTKGKKKDER